MRNVWTVARQTVSEAIRMKIAVFFVLLLGVLVLGLPFVSSGDGTISGAVQSFLVYSITSVTFLLSCLSIFLCKSISDDLTGKQIMILMTKPIARWEYILGKWFGIVLLNTTLLAVSAGVTYGMSMYIASRPPRDELDKQRLESEVLVARHGSRYMIPDFSAAAARQYEEELETGRFASILDHDPDLEKKRNRSEIERNWRSVQPGEAREFIFEDVRCERTADQMIHFVYEARIYNYPPDEILRCMWIIGDRSKGTKEYRERRRDVRDRRQTVTAPADAVAPDNTVRAVFVNANFFEGEPQFPTTVVFEGPDAIETLFSVSSFMGNFVRAILLVWCRLVFLSAVGVLASAVFSFPVACLVALTVYAVATMSGFVMESLDFMTDEGVVVDVFRTVARIAVSAVKFVLPNFSEVDGVENLVAGRNVTLKWVLIGLGKLVAVQTGILLLAACLLFQRREVSEVSV
jgi:hypothetical protein